MNWQQKRRLAPKVVTALCECSPEEVHYDSERLIVLNQHLQSLIQEGKFLSANYCLWRGGRVFADAAIGNLACSWQGRTQVMPDTFFEIQSVVKVFTAVAILKLAEDGMLYLGQPVHDWIPEFGVDGFRDITIVHLLTHTSGLSAISGALEPEKCAWWKNLDKKDIKGSWISAIVKAGLHAKPGEKWIYSAIGFAVLGEIIERAVGMRAESFIQEYILLPCGMRETHWRESVTQEWIKRYNISKPLDIAATQKYKDKGIEAFARSDWLWWDGIPNTAGGVMSICREMVQFGEMLLRDGSYQGKRVIGRTALSYLWTNLVRDGLRDYCWGHPGYLVAYGAGVPIVRQREELQQIVSENVIFHEGSGSCAFMVDKKEDFVVMFQVSFPDEKTWYWDALKGTASIIWSGLK